MYDLIAVYGNQNLQFCSFIMKQAPGQTPPPKKMGSVYRLGLLLFAKPIQ